MLKEKSGEEGNKLALGGIYVWNWYAGTHHHYDHYLDYFGAGKLPEIGAGMGKAIKNFKGAMSEIEHK